MGRRLLYLWLILFLSVASFGQKTSRQILKPIGDGKYIAVQKPVYFDVSPPLKEMIKNASEPVVTENRDLEAKIEEAAMRYLKSRLKGTAENNPDPLSKIQKNYSALNSAKAVDLVDLANFDGVDNIDGVAPPDTHGDVNDQYYMQCVNNHTAIYDRVGNEVAAPFPTSDFWQGTGYDDRNDGDAVILWDEDAQRWVVTQFYLPSSGDQYLLIAVSTTPDPTGSYYRYAFAYQYMPDYPKWAIWHDGYYVGANAFDQNNNYSFEGAYVSAFDRDAMLQGASNPTAVTILDANQWSLFPVDADVLPDASIGGCYFMNDELSGYTGNSEVYLYQFNVDWANNTGTLNLVQTFSVASYDLFNSDTEVPQPGTSQDLDLLHYRTMYRSVFRAFKDHMSIVMSRTVNDGGIAAIRWYEFRNSGTGWSLYQQGTYNPGDGLWRWMPSIAMNAQGDIALGYSVSSDSKYPSIRVVARYADDPLGVMTSNEYEAYSGSAAQTGVSRWGDYAMVSVDPDFYSFWFTTEYTTGSWNWKTRIVHFDLPRSCTPPATQASNLALVSKTDNSATISWTRGSGDDVLIIARQDYPINVDPVNGESYLADAVFGNGDELAPGTFAVYNGTGTQVTITNLQAGHWYYFRIYEYNSADYCYNLDEDTLRVYISCDGPSTQASNFQVVSANDNDLTISWTRGNGDGVIVVAKQGAPVDTDPEIGTQYNASSIFGNGDEIGVGNYVVYDGTGTQVTVTGLTAGTTYYFAIYEYFASGYCYNTDELTGNGTTTGTPPCDYCYAWGNTDYLTSVTGVVFNTIDNSTGKDTDGNGNAYSDFTNISTDVYRGQAYDLTVRVNTDGNYTVDAMVWIDWNHDCDFDDPGEEYDLGDARNVSDGETSNSPLSITVPTDAVLGQTRMRVAAKYNAYPTSCETDFDGEVEDYTINVLDPNNPNIYVSTDNIDFGEVGLGYYATATYKVAGSNLSDDLVLSLTGDGFSISLDDNNYGTSLTLTPNNGTVDTTIVYVRFEPTAIQTYSGQITHSSTNADTKVINLSGEGQQWFPAPQNLVATENGTQVDLTWDEPANGGTAAGWNYYADINSSQYIYGPGFITQISKFDDDDLGYTYPIKITQLRAGFYDNNDWTSDQFRFVIFGLNLDTIFLSPFLTAVSQQEVTYTLTEPLFLTSDFYMGIITEASDGTPYLLLTQQPDNNYHSYGYDGSNWYYLSDGTNAYDWDLGIYIDNGAKAPTLITAAQDDNNTETSFAALQIENSLYKASLNSSKSVLKAYNVYKDGAYLASVDGNTTNYTDPDGCGTHSYYVTAVYEDYDGESDPSNTESTDIPITTITQHPADQDVCEGEVVTFSVVASGSNLTYQWYKDGSAIAGATSDTYTISAAATSDAGSYYCVVSGDCGTETSNTATLTVGEKTIITQQPSDQVVCEGDAFTLTVSATGTNLTYQWYKDGSAISGATSSSYSVSSASASDAGSYYCVIDGTCGTETSNTVSVTVNESTVITQQPSDQDVCEGDNVSFTVSATGTNITYQWYKDGSAISGATSSTYTITSVSTSDAGSYYCVVSGDCGTETSNTATLTVGETTAITQQPSDQVVCEGDAFTLTVSATGTNLTYQWYKDGSAISGATSSSYSVSSASTSDAGSYYCVVSGTCGTENSNTVSVTVNESTVITQQPSDQDVCEGDNVSFTVSATGTNLTYQWYKDGSAIAGATSNTYSISSVSASDAGSYYCEVSGDCGVQTSDVATLTVGETTVITQQPTDESVCEGASVTFTVSATGTNLTYQWYKDGSAISGATSDSYTIASVSTSDAGSYYCVVSGTCGTETSNSATLTVGESTVITQQPASQEVCEGDNVTLTVSATGTNLTYQWRKDGTNIPGATSSSYVINGISSADAGNYDCVVSGDCGTETSNVATITVNPATVITQQPVDQSACEGTDVTFTISADGSNLTYQWYKDGSAIAGATSNTLTLYSVTTSDEGTYTCEVSGDCGTETSNAATLTITTSLTLTDPSDQEVCEGQTAQFTVIANGSNPVYQWRKNGVDLTDGGNISGANTATLTISNVSSADVASYTCFVTSDCGDDESNAATLSLLDNTQITQQPSDQVVCEGEAVSFTVSATGSNLTYQWYKDGTSIPGATSSTYNINNVTSADAGSYYCEVSGDCGTVSSNSATLTVNPITVITDQPTGTTICEGEAFTLSVSADGSNLTYQWYKDGSAIAGATSSTYTVANATTADAGTYYCEVSGDCGNATSDNAVVNVNAGTVITTQPADASACVGGSVTFTVEAEGTNLTYQWRKDGSNIAGATSNVLVLNNVALSDAGVYDCIVSGDCGTETSNGATLSVVEGTQITEQPQSQDVCEGEAFTLTITAEGSNLTYQWYKDGSAIAGATSSSYTVANATTADAGSYYCEVSGDCGDATSDVATVNITEGTVITQQPESYEVCEGASVTFSITAEGSNLTYQWYKDGSAISGANSNVLTLNNVTVADAGSYECEVVGDCGVAISDEATLTVNPATVITEQPQSQDICEGSSFELIVVADGTNLTYQWYKDGSAISGATSNIYSVASATTADAGNYYCEVTGDCGSVNSDVAVVNVAPGITITQQPESQTVCEGETVTFVVVADGENLTYQWYKDGSAITGATSNTYTINGVTTADAGDYYCEITGDCGVMNSDVATLTVSNSVVILEQPQSQAVCQGEQVIFSVSVDGNASYQWYFNDTPITDANSDTYVIDSATVDNAGYYYCEITGDCGTAFSDTAMLTVYEGVVIISQPDTLYAQEGDTVAMIVEAAGSNLMYQWRKDGVDLVEDGHFSGVNSDTLTIDSVTVDDAGVYTCYITSDCGEIETDTILLILEPTFVVSSSLAVKVYPNPAADVLNIKFVSIDDNMSLTITDELGKVVYKGNVVEKFETIDVSSWAVGVYNLKITSDKGTVYIKVIKR